MRSFRKLYLAHSSGDPLPPLPADVSGYQLQMIKSQVIIHRKYLASPISKEIKSIKLHNNKTLTVGALGIYQKESWVLVNEHQNTSEGVFSFVICPLVAISAEEGISWTGHYLYHPVVINMATLYTIFNPSAVFVVSTTGAN